MFYDLYAPVSLLNSPWNHFVQILNQLRGSRAAEKRQKMKKDCESQSFFLHVKQSENYMEGGLWE